jgi:hypothetical protein
MDASPWSSGIARIGQILWCVTAWSIEVYAAIFRTCEATMARNVIKTPSGCCWSKRRNCRRSLSGVPSSSVVIVSLSCRKRS